MSPEVRWAELRGRLTERSKMAHKVLDETGHVGVPIVIPIEEVVIWMDELERS
jgi:hypothetical protein